MSHDYGLIGNGSLLARVRADGVMAEAFYPSVGYFRHFVQSRFGVWLAPEEGQGPPRAAAAPAPAEGDRQVPGARQAAAGEGERPAGPGRLLWFTSADCRVEQRYLDETNVLETRCVREGLEAVIHDFAHPELSCLVRTLEVRNTGSAPLPLALLHAEASSVADHKGEFGNNVTYYNRLRNHFVCYRGHPWDNAVEAQIVWLLAGHPVPESYQCGASYQDGGASLDAFLDMADGQLQENRYVFGYPNGTTSGMLWRRRLEPGETCAVAALMVPGMTLFDAEDLLEQVRERDPERLFGEAVTWWRNWLERGRATVPPLGDARLERLYLRSLLLLKLLQDRQFGSFIAAPTLEPDYRYCWPRDAVYLAWALDRCGYHEEAGQFYRWCRRTQMIDGLWYQNHYTDGRRHWAGIQVDQVATVLWGAWEHFRLTRRRGFLVEMWPTLRRAAEYLLSRTNPQLGLVYSEQDLWEETGGYLTYTQAACVAGWEAAAAAAREVGRESDAARWEAAARALRRRIQEVLRDEAEALYAGEHQPRRPFPMRPDYLLDISNLGLAAPFRVVPAAAPELARTAARLEAEFEYPVGGVGRYRGDLFMGGNPWSLAALWLALYYVEAGRVDDVYRQLRWCLLHATAHDFLPEQSHRATGAPVGAAPLGWSHAWVVVLLQRLGRLLGARHYPAAGRATAAPRALHAPASTPEPAPGPPPPREGQGPSSGAGWDAPSAK